MKFVIFVKKDDRCAEFVGLVKNRTGEKYPADHVLRNNNDMLPFAG